MRTPSNLTMSLTAVLLAGVVCSAASIESAIFPRPQEITASGADFVVDEGAAIVLPASPTEHDVFLARSLADELGDRFGVHLQIERSARLQPGRRVILMGSVLNPLVRARVGEEALAVTPHKPGPEGYILRVDSASILIAGSDDSGAFYGLQSLRQLAARRDGRVVVPGVNVRDWPDKPFRGIKLYLPGRDNIPYFKRFVSDFMALHKYNTLMMEMNASMRLDRHPELNSSWLEFARDTNYSRRNYPPGAPHDLEQNSSHQDTADGGFLEKAEVADLARWVRQHHIELVPELPSLTHSFYLLGPHKELSEVPGEKWPDTYCPSNPKSYELLFDVYDEYIEVLKPKMIHAGHDELFLPVGLCPLCKDKNIQERFGEDVRKIHDHLASKGIRMAIWGDMLLEEVRGKGLIEKKTPSGWTYKAPGGMTPEQVERLIPKDVLIFNWFWNKEEGSWSQQEAEEHEAKLDRMGFQQVFGNFNPGIADYEARSKRPTLVGGAPSAWFATNEWGFGKDLMSDFLGCANILWTGHVVTGRELSGIVQAMLPELRVRLRGALVPSRTEPATAPLDISKSFNMGAAAPKLGVDLSGLTGNPVSLGGVRFNMAPARGKTAIIVGTDGKEPSGLPKEAVVPIGEDATSLLFLHASARPAANRDVFYLLWDQDDSADLLGWYEVVYADGFTTTIPIRYGVNIAEWNWDQRTSARDYCYGADAVAAGAQNRNRITFFAYEWSNPRLGKVIKEVRLRGTTGFRGADTDFSNKYGPVISANAVILKAITAVKKRDQS